MTEKNFDVIVIGAGPGGYVAAIRAAQLGKKTAVIEREHLGGICLNWGCIPTKSLLRSAEIYHYIENLDEFGLSVEKARADLTQIVKRSRKVAGQLANGVETLLKKNKVTIINGTAKLISAHQVQVSLQNNIDIYDAQNIIIATGARAKVIKGFEPDNKLVWTYKEAMIPEELPKSLIIVGSGAIGIEFASFYNALGVKVTVLEARGRILAGEDYDISKMAKQSLEKQGITFITDITLDGLKRYADNIELKFRVKSQTRSLVADRLIMAIGIVPNTSDIDLHHTNIQTDEQGFILTDPYLKTSEKNIYAIGDATLGPWLAHKASHEGIMAAEMIAGKLVKPIDKKLIPNCTYSNPQVASVGLTEDKARAAGHQIKVGLFPFIGNGKAITLGETKGLIKTIFDHDTGELLGAHMIGAEVTELIQSYVVAMNLEATEEDLFHIIFAHPTLSEMLQESALHAYGRAVHI